MALDTSIPLQTQSPQIEGPLDLANKYQQYQTGQMQNKLMQRKFKQLDTEDQRANKLSSIMQNAFDPNTGSIDPVKYKAGLVQAGMADEVQSADKMQLEQQQQQRLNALGKIEGGLKLIDYAHKILPNINEQNYGSFLEDITTKSKEGGFPPPQFPSQWHPGLNDEILQKSIPVKDQLAQTHQDLMMKLQQQQFGETQRHNLATESTSNEPLVQTVGPDGMPVYTPRSQAVGKSAYSPTGIGNKPMTESQGKANIFGTRAGEAHNILNNLEDTINVPGLAVKQAVDSGITGAIANSMLSPDQQKVDQAQRDFLNAVLRNESGALIGPTEFESGKKQYFPQPGDSAEVKAQKRKNRETEIKGLNQMAGQNAPVNAGQQPAQATPMTATNPKTGERVQSIDGGQTWHAIK